MAKKKAAAGRREAPRPTRPGPSGGKQPSRVRLVAWLGGVVLACLAAVLVLIVWRGPATTNVILISLDTLRADRLGCYGYSRPTSPTMDALARRGVRMSNAIAEASWTLPSHMTLFTSLFPSTHGVTLPEKKLSPEILTMGEILKKRGYRTYANTEGGFVNGQYGFGRGFEHYDNEKKSFQKTLQQAQNWIDQLTGDEPYFVFLHTYAVHCPYTPPPKYGAMFQTRPPEDHLDTTGKCGNPHYNSMGLTAGQVRFLSDQYDAEIRYADDCLAAFVQYLEKKKALANTILVILSDHGEEFGEHGKIGHERTLYMECLKVPMIFVSKNIKPRVVTETVGLSDVMPTVLDMLKIDAQETQGRSMVSLMEGKSGIWKAKQVVSELDRHVILRSISDGVFHLIADPKKASREVYNIRDDPWERVNLEARAEARAGELEELLLAYCEAAVGVHAPGTAEPDAELLKRLRSLGYAR